MDLLSIAAQHIAAGRVEQAAEVCREIVTTSPDQVGVYYILALIANARGDYADAVRFADFAIEMKAGVAEVLVEKARGLAALADREGAVAALRQAVRLSPDVANGYNPLANLLMPGENYHAVLSRFHDYLRPKGYLEIGVFSGQSLALARPPTVAVGIDPQPVLSVEPNTRTKIFKLPSDDYFATRDPRADLESDGIDLAFIDGLHVFEQALRDFINVEKHAKPGTVVLFHDCLPLDALTASPQRKTAFWSGDVWKVIAALIKWRPDLDVFTIPTPPTGLGVVVGLDPASTVLDDNYSQIVGELGMLPFELDDQMRWQSLHAINNDWAEVEKRVSGRRPAPAV